MLPNLKHVHEALNNEKTEEAIKLLDLKAIRKSINSLIKCETTLYKAVDKNNIDVVKKVLNIAKVDVNKGIVGVFGNYSSPLHAACRHSNLEIVEVLLAAGANWFKCDDKGMTPLHYAAGNGCEVIVRKLLEKQPTLVNRRTTHYKERPAAIHIASEAGHLETIQTLVHFGANLNLKTTVTDKTAYEIAKDFNKSEIVRYLESIRVSEIHTTLTAESNCDGHLVETIWPNMGDRIEGQSYTFGNDDDDSDNEDGHIKVLTDQLKELQAIQKTVKEDVNNLRQKIKTLSEAQKKTEKEAKRTNQKLQIMNEKVSAIGSRVSNLEMLNPDDNSSISSDPSINADFHKPQCYVNHPKKKWKWNHFDKDRAKRMQKVVRRNMQYLIDHMTPEPHLIYLCQMEVITLGCIEELKDLPVHKQNRDLILKLLKTPGTWVYTFEKSLNEHQPFLLEIFNKV